MVRDRLDQKKTDAELAAKEEALKRERDWQMLLHNDKARLLQMPEFQRVMNEIIAKGGMFQTVMTGNSQTFYLAGKQDFVKEIWSGLMAVNPDAAFDLLKTKNGDFNV